MINENILKNYKDEMDVKTQYVIIHGNFTEGYQCFGPFDSFDDACYYSDEHKLMGSWVSSMTKEIK